MHLETFRHFETPIKSPSLSVATTMKKLRRRFSGLVMKLVEYQRVKSVFASLPMNAASHALAAQFPEPPWTRCSPSTDKSLAESYARRTGNRAVYRIVGETIPTRRRRVRHRDERGLSSSQLMRLIIESVLKVNHKSVGIAETSARWKRVSERSAGRFRAMTSGLCTTANKGKIDRTIKSRLRTSRRVGFRGLSSNGTVPKRSRSTAEDIGRRVDGYRRTV